MALKGVPSGGTEVEVEELWWEEAILDFEVWNARVVLQMELWQGFSRWSCFEVTVDLGV